MKQLYLTLMISLSVLSVFGQTQVCQTFTGRHDLPEDWFAGGGAQVTNYENPGLGCAADVGLQTPGIGGTNPSRVIQAARTYSSSFPNIVSSFDIFVFDANTKCSSSKDFPCSTWVKISLVKGTYTDVNGEPDAADVYAETEYQIAIANGNNTAVFNTPSIPNGAAFRIMYDFKSTGAECVQGNTKYIIDNICSNERNGCPQSGCAPYANDDLFFQGQPTSFSGNSFNANVYGGNLSWTPPVGYELKSLGSSPAVNNGVDGDDDNPNLSTMTFNLVSGLEIVSSSGCEASPALGTLSFNSNGTFSFTRGNPCISSLKFVYRIQDDAAHASNNANVFIEFPANIPTPVQWKEFKAVRNGNAVHLTWTTASEWNNKGFNVQRNTRGSWENIAFVPSAADAGSSAVQQSYFYTDANAEKGLSQYRIQQVDIDGKSKYSEIRSVRGQEMSSRLLVYPNPSTTGTVSLVFEDQLVRDVQVMDLHGRVVQQIRNMPSGASIYGLERGVYTLRISSSIAGAITEKVVILKR